MPGRKQKKTGAGTALGLVHKEDVGAEDVGAEDVGAEEVGAENVGAEDIGEEDVDEEDVEEEKVGEESELGRSCVWAGAEEAEVDVELEQSSVPNSDRRHSGGSAAKW